MPDDNYVFRTDANRVNEKEKSITEFICSAFFFYDRQDSFMNVIDPADVVFFYKKRIYSVPGVLRSDQILKN